MPTFDLGYAPSQHRSKRPGYNGTSLQEFFDVFPNDDACLAHVFRRRFGTDPQCPRCAKRGRWQRHEVQKHFFHPCGGILSPMSGVVFSRSRIPLQLWFYAMLHFANSPEGRSAGFLARQLGVSLPTGFRICTRIRWHMAQIDRAKTLGQPNQDVMANIVTVRRILNNRKNCANSASILLLSDSARVNSTVLGERQLKNVKEIVKKKVNPDSNLVSDCYWTSRFFSNYGKQRSLVNFTPDYFFKNLHIRNLNHGFMQYFNLSFADQFRGVSLQNAWLYFKEYEFRFNRRDVSETTFWELVNNFPTFEEDQMEQVRNDNFLLSAQ